MIDGVLHTVGDRCGQRATDSGGPMTLSTFNQLNTPVWLSSSPKTVRLRHEGDWFPNPHVTHPAPYDDPADL